MTKEEVMKYCKDRKKENKKKQLPTTIKLEVEIEFETIDVIVQTKLEHENDNY